MSGQPRIEYLPLIPALAAGQDQEVTLLVRITPAEPPRDTTRPPLNLALVIDRSGSMHGSKLLLAQQAACNVIDLLSPQDRVSLVTFDHLVETLVPSTLVQDRAMLKTVVYSIRARGSTALHGGWVEGGLNVSAHLQDGALNRVILLSDGRANVGKRDPDEIAHDVRGLTERGVSTSTFGMGDSYDEVLLEAMSLAGDGNYHYIRQDQLEMLPEVLAEELFGLSATLARQVTLRQQPGEGVTANESLNGLPLDEAGRIKLPNLVDGAPIEVVLNWSVAADFLPEAGSTLTAGLLQLAWTDLQGQQQDMNHTVNLPVVTSDEYRQFEPHPETATLVALLKAAKAKQDAVRAMDEGDRERARSSLQSAGDFIAYASSPGVRMRESRDLSELITSFDRQEFARSRKLASSQSYDTRRGRTRPSADWKEDSPVEDRGKK